MRKWFDKWFDKPYLLLLLVLILLSTLTGCTYHSHKVVPISKTPTSADSLKMCNPVARCLPYTHM